MAEDQGAVVSPADARIVVGSFHETSLLFLKEKFFSFEELLGHNKKQWLEAFSDGDFAVFRLIPDKYHYKLDLPRSRLGEFLITDGNAFDPLVRCELLASAEDLSADERLDLLCHFRVTVCDKLFRHRHGRNRITAGFGEHAAV